MATYLLLHGIAKLVLVGALLRQAISSLSIAVLVGFIVYQFYDIATEGPASG